MAASMTRPLTPDDLRLFTGSESWYHHAIVPNILCTDGARYVDEQGGAYWLLDEIALAQKRAAAGVGGILPGLETARQGQSQRHIDLRERQRLCRLSEDTRVYGFPLDEITFYLTNTTILLPSEY